MEKIPLREVAVVEGRYDKIRLESVVDAAIVTTEGFRVFNDREKQAMLRRLAEERGLLVITDSDGAGFVIRRFLSGCIPKDRIKHAYIPQISGKEKRKSSPSKEGLLGVEGLDRETLLAALRSAGVTTGAESAAPADSAENEESAVTRAVLFDDGFIGGKNSAKRRAALLERLKLPSYLSVNALLGIINIIVTREQYDAIVDEIAVQTGAGE